MNRCKTYFCAPGTRGSRLELPVFGLAFPNDSLAHAVCRLAFGVRRLEIAVRRLEIGDYKPEDTVCKAENLLIP